MTKSRFSMVVLLVVLALILLLPTAAVAWPKDCGQPAFRAAYASATQQLSDGSEAYVDVWASDAPPAGGFVTATVQYRHIRWLSESEGELLGFAYGEVTLAGPSFKGTGSSFVRASLTATVPMNGVLSGEPWGDAEVNLAWVGTGAVSGGSEHYIYSDEETGLVYRVNSVSRSREAVVSGSLVLPDDSTFGAADLTGGMYGGITVTNPSK